VLPPKQKKPPSHESTTEKTVRVLSSNLVQPRKQKKPLTIKKMVEPILNKRKLAWETTEEGKITIGAQHIHEFFNNMNTKQQQRELEKTKNLDPGKLRFFKLMSENSKKMIPIMASTSYKEDTRAKKLEKKTDVSMSKKTYVASGLNANERALAKLPTEELVQVIDFMEQSGMPISVALGHEEPPRDPSFVHRWPFQLRNPLIRQELVYKISTKMYKFHEWYMQHSAKDVDTLGILAKLDDFASEGDKVV
jgi:hypothetical protein